MLIPSIASLDAAGTTPEMSMKLSNPSRNQLSWPERSENLLSDRSIVLSCPCRDMNAKIVVERLVNHYLMHRLHANQPPTRRSLCRHAETTKLRRRGLGRLVTDKKYFFMGGLKCLLHLAGARRSRRIGENRKVRNELIDHSDCC
jgi:hypothetical protein